MSTTILQQTLCDKLLLIVTDKKKKKKNFNGEQELKLVTTCHIKFIVKTDKHSITCL